MDNEFIVNASLLLLVGVVLGHLVYPIFAFYGPRIRSLLVRRQTETTAQSDDATGIVTIGRNAGVNR